MSISNIGKARLYARRFHRLHYRQWYQRLSTAVAALKFNVKSNSQYIAAIGA